MAGQNDGTGCQEQQRFKERVGHQVENRRIPCLHAKREEHVANLAHGRVSENTFDVGLYQRGKTGQQQRNRPDNTHQMQNFREMVELAPAHFADGNNMLMWATLMLLGGAVGKSAQLPLQTWLADAMAGPTPVSALIHAATMVTAGVYLIARTHGLFLMTPEVLHLVGIVGAVTLVLAGFAALVQTDIKRVLAYSTMSQIGYMFLAL